VLSILGTILPGIIGILGRSIPDANARSQAQEEITKLILSNEAEITRAAKDVVTAEINSDSWMAKNWRPFLMFLLMALLVWMVTVAPIFGLVEATKNSLKAVPGDLWMLLQIGMGGYILGRSGEKIATAFADSKKGK
jgi:hypothetical protein